MIIRKKHCVKVVDKKINFEDVNVEINLLINNLKKFSNGKKLEKQFFFETKDICENLSILMGKLGLYYSKRIACDIEEKMDLFNEGGQIYLLTFLIKLLRDKNYIKRLINLIIDSRNINIVEKYFLFWQIKLTIAKYNIVLDLETKKKIENFYFIIYKYYFDKIENKSFIPKNERNEELIFVITYQMLDENHKPSKNVLEICYQLKSLMKKKIILINTKELAIQKEWIPIYEIYEANHRNIYNKNDILIYKNVKIPYYELEDNVPDIAQYSHIIDMIKKYKPMYILSLADNSIISDLCSESVPNIVIQSEKKDICIGHNVNLNIDIEKNADIFISEINKLILE